MRKLVLFGDSNSIHTKKWVEILIDHYEIHLISFSTNKISGVQNYNIPVGKINPTGGNYKYIFKIVKIRKLVRIINPVIINAHYLTSYGFIASIVKPKACRLILSVHGSDIFITPNKNRLYNLLTKITLKKADHIFSVSKAMTRRIILLTSIQPNKITTIQYGINVEEISKQAKSERNIDFVTNRNLIPNSNVLIILKAFAKFIQEVNSKSCLYVIGDGPLYGDLLQFATKNKLLGNVKFTGKIANEDLVKLLGKSKYYISLTSSDGLSLSLLEAMASKTIPIVSDIVANTEWTVNGQNGYVSKIDVNELFLVLKNLKYDMKFGEKNLISVMKFGNFSTNKAIILRAIL